MSIEYHFRTETNLALGLRALLERLEAALDLKEPIKMYLAGGMAAHLYTGGRVTTDVDAEFSRRIFIPADIMIETADGQLLYIDTNYNSTFALMHEDYQVDAVSVPMDLKMLEVCVLSPVDLVVSKIARYADHDRQDIEAIVRAGLVTAEEINARAREALGGYVGNLRTVELNLVEAVTLANNVAPIDKSKLTNIAPENVVIDGIYSGKVISIDGEVVVQKVGRDPDKIVRHDLSKLTAAVKVGECVDIKYKNGIGVVSGPGFDLENDCDSSPSTGM
jgi:hypothetical protein